MSSDVDRIKERLSIVDVVSTYVDLKPAGNRLKGLSPFTSEKTPSFFVSPEQGYYHCFSTDQGGDIFTFIQTIEGLDFMGALKLLAERAGVELSGNYKSDNKDEKSKLYKALDDANKFFIASYKVATVAQHFAKKRGINDDSVNRFTIGYAPDDWRRLHSELIKKYDEDLLIEAGLVKQKNNATYDVFRDRLMFPIRDIAGRVVGFSGRRLDGEKIAKYLNSPETPVFKKSSVLYGLYEGRSMIKKLDFSILVEGQIDLVLSHQAGYQNTLASSGTAFTSKHLEIIKRYSNNLLLAFDSDQAGLKASIKVAEMAYRSDLVVKVIDMDDGEDPADIIQKNPDQWKEKIKSARFLPEYLASRAKTKSRNETQFMNALSNVIVPLLNLISSPIQQRYLLEQVAQISDVELSVLQKELDQYQSKQKNQPVKNIAKSSSTHPVITLNSKEDLLKDIAKKRHWLMHHYPKKTIPDLPFSESELPELSSKDLMEFDYKDFTTTRNSYAISIKDWVIANQREELDEKIRLIQQKETKSPDDLNQLHHLLKQREDLLDSSE